MRKGCGHWSFEGIPEAIIAMGRAGRHGHWGRGWNWGGDWGDWGGGRGRGRKRMFESGELRLVLLKLIAEQPRHGYDLMRAIEEMSGGSYAPSPGVVYPTLTMLQDMGFIEEAKGKGPRKAFSATTEGEAHLEENAEEAEALFDRLRDAGEREAKRTGGAPISRAVGNVLSALWHSVAREDVTEDRLHEIAAILDEAAQKIERVK
jgi:DNA-binding PadR family transcriptional regulator